MLITFAACIIVFLAAFVYSLRCMADTPRNRARWRETARTRRAVNAYRAATPSVELRF